MCDLCTIVSMETDHSKFRVFFVLVFFFFLHVSRLTIRLDEFIFLSRHKQQLKRKSRKKKKNNTRVYNILKIKLT